MLLLPGLLCLLAPIFIRADKAADLVVNLPGLTYTPTFNQYSGYLDASTGNHLHYWFVEAQTSPQWAPLVLWLNGGPGCSSLGGLLTENGPFHPTGDGMSLVENVHSWNKAANVLYLESPRDVGFSYRESKIYGNDTLYNDDKTALDTVLALQSFYAKFPEYSGRDFYITGESYGGVYVPTATRLTIQWIQQGKLPGVNLVGMAVGNGELSTKQQINSAVDLLYYRGMLGMEQYNSLRQCCPTPNAPIAECDFSQYVTIGMGGDLQPINQPNNTIFNQCSLKVVKFAQDKLWNSVNDVYNSYQDCYNFTGLGMSGLQGAAGHATAKTILTSRTNQAIVKSSQAASAMFSTGTNPFVDQGSLFNAMSTDAMNQFQCYMQTSPAVYLNQPAVRAALHIPTFVPTWSDCNDNINTNYVQQNHDTTAVFQGIIDSGYKLKMLVYNGDVDMACNFMGDEWFVENLATTVYPMTIQSMRTSWNYTRPGGFASQIGGYVKKWGYKNVTMDLLTVKGAGHFVPTDRPAPALQMIFNFIYTRAYDTPIPYTLSPISLLPQFVPPPAKTWTRKQADRVWSLPGLTYTPNFKQYSGYLNGVPGNYLHYWLVESQSNPMTDPIVLWLNGGPGCSSLGGFLTELGPFHPNVDGKTLFENIYAWNKGANVIFLEGPRGVGFSVQNTTINPDTIYDDTRTAWDSFLAIKDFLTVYPEYQGRPFYVTGESYGGVYVPTLTSLLIDQIQAGNATGLNLVGMAVGNGELSELQQINSAIHLLYFHGFYGKQEWDALQPCCNNYTSDPKWFEYCDFTQYIRLGSDGTAYPKDNGGMCGQMVADMGYNRVWNTINDVYNLYQDCYHTAAIALSSRNLMRQSKQANLFKNPDSAPAYASMWTDNQGGFQCYMNTAAPTYLNLPDVRDALHISPMAPTWSDCNDNINANYKQQHNDTSAVFDHIVKSGYPLRMLIYNGDVDTVCNFMGDQWFIEALALRQGMSTTKKRDAWRYMTQIAGYGKQFTYGSGTIDLMTVKGAGHFVPTDRPGPALQMFTNFISGKDYNSAVNFNLAKTPLKKTYKVAQQLAFMAGNNKMPIGMFADPAAPEAEAPAVPAGSSHGNKYKKLKQRRLARAKGQDAGYRSKRSVSQDDAPPPPPAGSKAADLITNLPGLTFTPTFKQYSGYLPASQANYLHYWFVESQSADPTKDPLILWLNGGPGCSSIGGFLEELGPFHVNSDLMTLFENVFSWNKVGNVLFLEAPRGVGYSYRSNEAAADTLWNDDKTANDNVLALASFFNRFPEYKNRPFYITGESYGGVYVPTLVRALIPKIQSGDMGYVNLTGVAIGNGEMSQIQQINSAVPLLYFRGEHDKSDWDALSMCCNKSTVLPQTYCDFTSYIYLDQQGGAWPLYTDGSIAAQCGNLVVQQGFLDVWETDNDVYNTFSDCYLTPKQAGGNDVKEESADTQGPGHKRRMKRSALPPLMNKQGFINQAKQINYMSTDANQGFQCWSGNGAQSYMSDGEVRQALHIQTALPPWQDCNDDINGNYIQQHNDTFSVFADILNFGYKVKFLIYNGDVDMACQFLGDEWFIENLAYQKGMTATKRSSWNYTLPNNPPNIGGFYKTFTWKPNTPSTVTFDLLTVKGAGHFVPTDRPGPALQMLNNFVNGNSYSFNLNIDLTPKPLNQPLAPPQVTRNRADRVYDLPGLTFTPQFHQHSGYLSGATKGNYLHYWFVESQSQSAPTDPVVLWLTGGPGCSSIGALLLENGPFHPNPDGKTLFENVYSWNKGAHVLFLESPRMVGFSYQDPTLNNDTIWNDDRSAADAAAAIADFFSVYTQFQPNDFYITGESYGGVYVPTLTRLVIQQIQAGKLNVNLKGMSVGNGMVSPIQDIRSLPDFMYFHGLYGKSDYDAIRQCCPPSNNSMFYCNYEIYVNIDNTGSVNPKNFPGNQFMQNCANLVANQAQNRNWGSGNDVYNMYQDCYQRTTIAFGSAAKGREPIKPKPEINRVNYRQQLASLMTGFGSNPTMLDPVSTDAFGGFQCYWTDAVGTYFSQPGVRDALHVPDFVQPWQFCSDVVGNGYQLQYNDTTSVFQDIFNSGYNLKMLIYNGDADTACSMFEAEWMIENFAAMNSMNTIANRTQWMYGQMIAGYGKKFQKNNLTISLMTVKGAGHMVPADRPGPSLQLMTNFFQDKDYSTPIPYDLTRQPMLAQFTETGAGPVPAPQPTATPIPQNTATTQLPPVTSTAPTMPPVTTSPTALTTPPATTTPPVIVVVPSSSVGSTAAPTAGTTATTAPVNPVTTSPSSTLKYLNLFSLLFLLAIL